MDPFTLWTRSYFATYCGPSIPTLICCYSTPGSTSVHGIYHSPSRNYPPQQQDHQQYQNTWTHSPYRQEITLPPVRLTPLIMMQYQPYPMPHPQQTQIFSTVTQPII